MERLKSRKLIEQVFKSGNSFAIFPFRVFYLYVKSTTIPLQAGFGVSVKNFKKAVDRNRIKRLSREAYRLQKNQLQEALLEKELQLAIFFIYNGKELPLYTLISGKIGISLQRLINLVNEKPASIN
ncbi:MAG: ribonuclease P protein component [Chitinophagaceae bacterium]